MSANRKNTLYRPPPRHGLVALQTFCSRLSCHLTRTLGLWQQSGASDYETCFEEGKKLWHNLVQYIEDQKVPIFPKKSNECSIKINIININDDWYPDFLSYLWHISLTQFHHHLVLTFKATLCSFTILIASKSFLGFHSPVTGRMAALLHLTCCRTT